MSKIFTIFLIPELRRKILITLLFLVIYRIGYYVPLPVIDQEEMAKRMAETSQGALGQLLGFVSLFSGFLPISGLGHMTSIGTLLAFVIVCVGIIIMRRTNPNAPRP